MGIPAISATEAVRSFSELLNGIRYRGDRYTILRGGKPVATIGPVEPSPPARILGDLPALLRGLPGLDPDDTSFAEDVSLAARSQPPLPKVPPWE